MREGADAMLPVDTSPSRIATVHSTIVRRRALPFGYPFQPMTVAHFASISGPKLVTYLNQDKFDP